MANKDIFQMIGGRKFFVVLALEVIAAVAMFLKIADFMAWSIAAGSFAAGFLGANVLSAKVAKPTPPSQV